MINVVGNGSHSNIEQKIIKFLLSEEVDNKLKDLSTESLLELWEGLEKEIKIVFTKQINDFTEDKDISDIEVEQKELKMLKQKVIHKLLSDDRNGLLDMLVMDKFPGSKIVSTYFITKSNIIIEEEDGDRECMDIEDIKLEEIREFYDKLNSGGKPEDVVEVLSFIQKSIVEVEDIGEDIGGELSKDCRNPQVLKSLGELAEELEKSIKVVKQQTALLMSNISHLEEKGYYLHVSSIDNRVNLIKKEIINIGDFVRFDSIKSLDENTIVAKIDEKLLFKSLSGDGEIEIYSYSDNEIKSIYNLASIIVKKGYKGAIRKMPHHKESPENSELFFRLDLEDIKRGCSEVDFESGINYIIFSEDGEIVKNPKNKVKSNTNDYGAVIDKGGVINWGGSSN